MREISKLLKRLILTVMVLSVGGCGLIGESTGAPDICPVPAILKELQEMVRFKPGAGTDLSDVIVHVKMNTFNGVCDIGEKEISLSMAIEMTALRGAAMVEDNARFSFLVWILDRNKEVLSRNRFPIISKFEGRDSRIDFSDTFDVIIPQRADHAPTDWIVYMGLELSKEELAYNRRRLGSKKR
jgi:hypothetical protein